MKVEKQIKTEEEWKKELTAEEYTVMRDKGTERPFAGKYYKNEAKGTYKCAACGHPVFSSETKYDSGTGWPSFYDQLKDDSVKKEIDTTHGMTRTEVNCSNCGSHLGHLFDDGPSPTEKRYCINSIALKFKEK